MVRGYLGIEIFVFLVYIVFMLFWIFRDLYYLVWIEVEGYKLEFWVRIGIGR